MIHVVTLESLVTNKYRQGLYIDASSTLRLSIVTLFAQFVTRKLSFCHFGPPQMCLLRCFYWSNSYNQFLLKDFWKNIFYFLGWF